MTVSTTNSDFAAPGNNLWGTILRGFAGLRAGYSAYLQFSDLSRMSDAQLRDIGLTRADVPRAAAARIFDAG